MRSKTEALKRFPREEYRTALITTPYELLLRQEFFYVTDQKKISYIPKNGLKENFPHTVKL